MKYVVYNKFDNDWEFAETIEKAIEVGNSMAVSSEGYLVESTGDIKIYEFEDDFTYVDFFGELRDNKLIKQIEIEVVDKASNYKYESEEDAIWHADQEAIYSEDYWQHGDVDEVWTHRWVDVI